MTPERSGHRDEGIRELEQGDLDRALDLLARAAVEDGRDARARAFLAVAYSRKGLAAQARRTIQNALELQPSNSEFRYLLGTILEREGDTEGAATAYRECLRRQPDYEVAAARLELMGIQPLVPDPPPPAPEPAPAPPPMPEMPRPAPAAAPVAGPSGTVRCGRCLEWSKPGLSCEWCAGPLVSRAATIAAAPSVPVPPPALYGPPPAPYAVPPPPGMPPGPPGLHPYPPLYKKPHRGGAVLTLGILGLFFVLTGFGCAPVVLGGLVMSLLAWVFGNTDMAEMEAGLVDELGRGTVQAGRVLGIIGTLAAFLVLLGWVFLALLITA